LLFAFFKINPFRDQRQLLALITSAITFAAAPMISKFMTGHIVDIQELDSSQVGKFYTAIKCLAYTYQALVFYMNIIVLISYGVFSADDGFSFYKGERIYVGTMVPVVIAMLFFLLCLYPILVGLQCQIFKSVSGLKAESETGSTLLEGLGVKIRDISCRTGSVNLSEDNQEEAPKENSPEDQNGTNCPVSTVVGN
jgi:hypothetical protein